MPRGTLSESCESYHEIVLTSLVHTVTVVVLYNNLPPVIKWQTGATTFFIKQTSALVNSAGARSRRVKLYTPISQFNE